MYLRRPTPGNPELIPTYLDGELQAVELAFAELTSIFNIAVI